jgi:hypothetical protein
MIVPQTTSRAPTAPAIPLSAAATTNPNPATGFVAIFEGNKIQFPGNNFSL